MMDWWTSIGSSQRAAATCTGGLVDQVACGAQLDVASAIFDPWLNPDDLDLGAILNQTSCGTVTTTTNSAPDASASAIASNTTTGAGADLLTNQTLAGNNQQRLSTQTRQNHHQQHNLLTQTAASYSRLPAENKRHIISIVNNSTTSQHSSQQLQQSSGTVANWPGGNSIAGSPLSSSLGSSPLNNQTNYLSSPHSSSSPSAPQQQNHYQNFTEQSPNNNDSNATTGSSSRNNNESNVSLADDRKALVDCVQQDQQQVVRVLPIQECYLVEGVGQESSLSLENQNGQMQNGGAYMLQSSSIGGPQLVYQDNIIVMPCPDRPQQQQHRLGPRSLIALAGPSRSNACSGGSSLLSGSPAASSSSNQQRQTTKQIVASDNKSTTTSKVYDNRIQTNKLLNHSEREGSTQEQQLSYKVRRCRHITDYVLAEEEKRLLIKEGHTDFPMSCQARPLTKNEEKILRRIRRKIRNKKSAQCSRQRKKEYVEELERKYEEVLRENEELRRLLSSGLDVDSKFIDQSA